MEITGAQLAVKILEEQGVETVAGIPGGTILPFYDALSASNRIRHILTRHEQGAGFLAQGMARASGKPGVCIATSGPGVTNLLTAVADARLDSVPLICLTGQVPQAMIGTDAFQEVDTYGLSIPITKYNYLVRNAEELPAILSEAFEIAQSGRPGPVWIDIPKDVQTQKVAADIPLVPSDLRPLPHVDLTKVAQAAEMINRAKRPILYIGGGVIASEASAHVKRLAEHANLPITSTLMALGAVPSDHPLFLGMLGMHGARSTNYVLHETDLLVVVGARFDDRAIGQAASFCPDAAVIHIDIDAAELDKIRTAHVGIVGDVGEVIDHLLPLVAAAPRGEWLARIGALQNKYPSVLPGVEDPRSPYGLIRAAARCAGKDAVVVTDVGQHQMRVAQAYPFCRPRQWLTSGGLGTMGFGLPAALGAALAEPQRTVVCFSGDGSLMMNIQEMATAAEEGIPVKVVLMDNQSLGLVHQQQSLFYGNRIFAADYRRHTDFMALASAFGWTACDLGTASDPERAMAEAFAAPGPALVHCSVDAGEPVFPMVPPGAPNTEMIGG